MGLFALWRALIQRPFAEVKGLSYVLAGGKEGGWAGRVAGWLEDLEVRENAEFLFLMAMKFGIHPDIMAQVFWAEMAGIDTGGWAHHCVYLDNVGKN